MKEFQKESVVAVLLSDVNTMLVYSDVQSLSHVSSFFLLPSQHSSHLYCCFNGVLSAHRHVEGLRPAWNGKGLEETVYIHYKLINKPTN